MRNTGKQAPPAKCQGWCSSLYFGCFVKSFYFVWCEPVSSCQECSGEGAAIAVSARWAVSTAKVAARIAIERRVVGNVNVTSTSECRPMVHVRVYGTFVISIFPGLRQFDRCPSWLVHQWKQKRFWIVLIRAIVTVDWERKEKEVSANSDIVVVLTAKPSISCNFFKVSRYTRKRLVDSYCGEERGSLFHHLLLLLCGTTFYVPRTLFARRDPPT